MTDAGWMPDPLGRHELRYWDGSSWTQFVSDQGQQSTDPLQPPPPPSGPQPQGGPQPSTGGPQQQAPGGPQQIAWSPPPKKKRKVPVWGWILGAFAVLIVITAIAGGGETENGDSGDQATAADKAEREAVGSQKEDGGDDCGSTATDDCTPHVASNRSVRVDALIWKVTDIRVAATLGDQQFGLGEKADGRFVVVTLRVRSDKDESVTLTNNVFQLEVDGNTYDPDNEGTVAAVGAGEDPFFLEDIGPDATTTGKVVFDVPESVLSKKVEMRFNELGLGSTHGYIRIPSASLR